MAALKDLHDPADYSTFDHVGLCALSQTELLKCSKGILSQVGVIIALGVKRLDEHGDDIVLLEKIRSALVLVRQTIQESYQVLFDLERLGVEEDLEHGTLFISLTPGVGALDLQQVKVDKRGQDLPTHGGRDTGQAPAQGLQRGADVSFV